MNTHKQTTSHGILESGAHPTWGNDGQDEARARAFIEGVKAAGASQLPPKDTQHDLAGCCALGFCGPERAQAVRDQAKSKARKFNSHYPRGGEAREVSVRPHAPLEWSAKDEQ